MQEESSGCWTLDFDHVSHPSIYNTKGKMVFKHLALRDKTFINCTEYNPSFEIVLHFMSS